MGKEIAYGHDQAQRINYTVLAQVYDEVDKEIERSLLAGTPDIALGYAESLVATAHLRGVQLMKLFYELDKNWEQFNTDDDIEDYIFNRLGVSPRKFKEYRDMYRYIVKDHPEMAGKPVYGLLGILHVAREGKFDEEDWKELARAPDSVTMFDIRRRVSDVQTSQHTRLVIVWNRDGQLYCWRGDGERKHIGYLTRDETDPDVAAAVTRLTNPDKTGVMVQ